MDRLYNELNYQGDKHDIGELISYRREVFDYADVELEESPTLLFDEILARSKRVKTSLPVLEERLKIIEEENRLEIEDTIIEEIEDEFFAINEIVKQNHKKRLASIEHPPWDGNLLVILEENRYNSEDIKHATELFNYTVDKLNTKFSEVRRNLSYRVHYNIMDVENSEPIIRGITLVLIKE